MHASQETAKDSSSTQELRFPYQCFTERGDSIPKRLQWQAVESGLELQNK